VPFKADCGANRKRVPISDIAFGSKCLKALKEQPVRHYVIESTKYDAAMCHAVIAAMICARCKFTVANIILKPEVQLQSDWIARPTDEASVRIRS